ncbi:hypothetical protein GS429_15020 [Natronorubrum sp. JWXQ-INN-674]|uniref:DUF7115 domain-containing protein n=1 Tax=Natronorubrum halalkaliphilum TaxID=2691917 RepID=A0A6B0VRD0_9EURY|nr:hypothetical protein [Natronorubrum halalkaliphilum]MXV63352.1 hypothetical protein [Natronorubrum halalkaliphilum]
MSVPGIVQSTLNGEEIAARVSLGSEDELFITPSSTLVYRSDGLLSDESVDEFPHDADRLTLSEGRRKTKFSLEYPLDGTREFTVPPSKTDAVLHPVLAGVLNGNEITDPGETVVQTYRFSELTLIITSDRLVKHIGGAVWDGDYEEYHFADVTGLAFEDGSVATQIVLTANGRPQRIKAPNEEANDLRERLKRALFEYHDVGSLEELNETLGDDDEPDQRREQASVDFGDGVDPLDANPPELDDRETSDEPSHEAGGRTDPQSSDPLAGDTAAVGTDPETVPAETESESESEAEAEAKAETEPKRELERESEPRQSPSRQRSDQQTETQTTTAPTQTGTQSTTKPRSQTESEPEPDRDAAATRETDTTFEMSAETSTDPEPELERSESIETGDASDRDDRDHEVDSATSILDSVTEPEPESDAEPDSGHGTDPELVERLESLEAAVEQQSELIERQQRTIEQLIAELREGR